jgi:mono/diheme cytochrome c family protein
MPAWGADLSTDQIDALVGFILSPGGSQLFTQYCGECHQAPELVASNPLELKRALDEGLTYPPHVNAKITDWSTAMIAEERSRLLNFLAAPDGERLFATNCSPCHGSAVAFSGSEKELRSLIAKGGLHLEMPPWQTKLSQTEIDTLANYVVDPEAEPSVKNLFDQYCKSCHGERVPTATNLDQARQIITTGGPHKTMPIWGDILTSEQLDALVQYTLQAAQGTPLAIGQQLFAANCAPCHGEFGEGGLNPSLPGDIIPPISSSEFLKTRDDTTIQAIIAQGQPDLGMMPFGTAYGGLLEDADIEAIVVYMRAWEANPPAALPPQIELPPPSASATPPAVPSFAADVMPILQAKCVVCHGSLGGWNTASYTSIMTSGNNAPVIIPGDAANSLLVQKLLGTQASGGIMPPSGKLSDSDLQIIVNWINAGALEK